MDPPLEEVVAAMMISDEDQAPLMVWSDEDSQAVITSSPSQEKL